MPKKAWLIMLALFLCLVTWLIYNEIDRPRRLKHNLGMVRGVITNVTLEAMNGHTAEISYKIQIGDKEITRTKRVTSGKCFNMATFFNLMNRNMEVVYEKSDPENCELLLSRKEYKEFKLMPPRDIVYILEALEIACGDYK